MTEPSWSVEHDAILADLAEAKGRVLRLQRALRVHWNVHRDMPVRTAEQIAERLRFYAEYECALDMLALIAQARVEAFTAGRAQAHEEAQADLARQMFPVRERPVPPEPRRMNPNPQAEMSFHRSEHGWTSICRSEHCEPVGGFVAGDPQ